METPESIVLSKCKDMLKRLEYAGHVRHWDRLNVGLHMNMQGYLQRHGKDGSPDLIAFVPVDRTMWIMFFEVKRADGKGIQSESQKQFEDKFVCFDNCRYLIVTDAKQIKQAVENARKTSPNYGKIPDGVLPEFIG